jgi:hypothetical protein
MSESEETQELQPLVRWGWPTSIGVSVLTFVFGFVLGGAGEGSPTSTADGTVPGPTVTTTVTATPAWPTINTDGKFEVGVNIQSGTYSSTTLGCFWARFDSGKVVASRFGAHEVVTVRPADDVFQSFGCAPWTREGSPRPPTPPWLTIPS